MSASHRDRYPARRRGSPIARPVVAGLFLALGFGGGIGGSVDWMNPELAAAAEATATESQSPSSNAKASDAGSATASAPKAETPATNTPVKAVTAQTAASKGTMVTGKAGSSSTVSASPTARVAAARTAGKTARTASTAGVTTTQTLAPQDERVTYQYNALGRRDPFKPLVGGGFVGADQSAAPPDVGGMRVVGIVWGADDKFALVEDPRGSSLVLRKGDKVMNGVVETLRRDAVVVKLSIDGQTQSVAIPLSRKGEQANESE